MSDSLTTEVYLGSGGGQSLDLEAAKSSLTPRFLLGMLVRDGLDRLRSGQFRIVNPANPRDLKSPATAIPEPAPVSLDIGPALTGSEALQFDALALRNGVTPEALAASAVRRLLRRDRQNPQDFRLKMPKEAKRKLVEHAEALGCGAGELAAFLFSRRAGRPQATVAGG